MNLLTLSAAGLRDNRLTHVLNILLLALGLGTVSLMIQVADGLRDHLVRDSGGVDLVVGAKGSPLQLVLSSLFQADVPTGNIKLADAEALSHNPLVDTVVPVALGDSVGSFRIVGTEPGYLTLYGAHLAEGALWTQPMEAVLGADAARRLKLDLGAHFTGAHGLAEGGPMHAHDPYVVTGILAPTGTLIDRLALTSIESVWHVHAGHNPNAEHEVTALLIRTRSPLAVVTLPHQINADTSLQAAAPSIELARLLSLIGVGLDVFRILAGLFIAAASLSVFITLYTRLRARRRELAVLRLLGGSRIQLLATMLIEGLLLAGLGAAAGLVLGHGAAFLLTRLVPPGDALASLGFGWRGEEWLIPTIALGVGAAAALVPAIGAYRADVAAALSGPAE